MANIQRKAVHFVNQENHVIEVQNKASRSSFPPSEKTQKLQTSLPASSSNLDQPRLNKLAELRKSLNEIKNYEAMILANTNDLSANSQQLVNRAVTSKLNYHMKDSVFNNLPKIDHTNTAENLIQRTIKRTKETNQKSNEVRDEIKELINKLVELEYKNEDMDRKTRYIALPNEDEFLGFKKFNEPNFALPSKKTETERFEKKVHHQLKKTIFGCEDYLANHHHKSPCIRRNTKECNCINSHDFYNHHSKCS